MKTLPSLIPELPSAFESEWSGATAMAKKAVASGFDEQTAAQMFLKPVEAKWAIINSSPSLLNDPEELMQFSQSFDRESDNFRKKFSEYNADGGEWALSKTLQPFMEKMKTKHRIPVPQNTMSDSEAVATKLLAGGADVLQLVSERPDLVEKSPVIAKAFESAMRNRNKPRKRNEVELAELSVKRKNYENALENSYSTPEEIAKAKSELEAELARFTNQESPAADILSPFPALMPKPVSQPPQEEKGYLIHMGGMDAQGNPFVRPGSRDIHIDTRKPLVPAEVAAPVVEPLPLTREQVNQAFSFPIAEQFAAAGLSAGLMPTSPLDVKQSGAQSSPVTQPEAKVEVVKYEKPEDVKAAYRAGKLTKEQAAKILAENFGFE